MPQRVARVARFLERLLEGTAVALMIALTLVVVVAVAFRKAGAGLVWYDEVAEALLAWLTFYAAGLAALKGAHLGFPRIVEALPPIPRRAARVLREIAVLGFFLLVTWAGIRVLGVLQGTSLVSLPWMPAAVAQSVIPLGGVLFVVAELLAVWRRP